MRWLSLCCILEWKDAEGDWHSFDPSVTHGILPKENKEKMLQGLARLDPEKVFDRDFLQRMLADEESLHPPAVATLKALQMVVLIQTGHHPTPQPDYL